MTKSSFIHDQGIGISSIRPENPPSNLLAAVWTEREPLSHRNPGEFFYRLKLTLAAGSVPRLRAPKGVQAPPTSPLRALPRLMSDASTESLVLLVQISHTPLILFFFNCSDAEGPTKKYSRTVWLETVVGDVASGFKGEILTLKRLFKYLTLPPPMGLSFVYSIIIFFYLITPFPRVFLY